MTRRVYTVVFAWTENMEAIASREKQGYDDAARVMFMMETAAKGWIDNPARSCCLLCERTAVLTSWNMVGGLFDNDDDLHCTFYICDGCSVSSRADQMEMARKKLAREINADIDVIPDDE